MTDRLESRLLALEGLAASLTTRISMFETNMVNLHAEVAKAKTIADALRDWKREQLLGVGNLEGRVKTLEDDLIIEVEA